MTPQDLMIAALLGNGTLLAILAYIAKEMRNDLRDVRDKVLVMWRWYNETVERRDIPSRMMSFMDRPKPELQR